jgi:hypothetical protein
MEIPEEEVYRALAGNYCHRVCYDIVTYEEVVNQRSLDEYV